ncbi:hypothetical protein H6F43_10245, partial [Leptolyngbya sp. FACHB-36]|nr:hypothetical protein [Leptolyngbya sp. FACHB-36]
MQRLRHFKKQFPSNSPRCAGFRSPLLLAFAVLALTSALGHRFYNAPRLDVGKAATQTIYAPASATVEDARATEEKRKAARKDSISVLMLDQAANQQIYQTLRQQLEQGTNLRQLAGSFPIVPTSVLSLRTQSYLRKLSENDWLTAQSLLTAVPSTRSARPKPTPGAIDPQVTAELQAYRQTSDIAAAFNLVQTIAQARFKYLTAIGSLPQPETPDAKSVYNASLFELTDADWQQTQTKVLEAAERILAQGIPVGLPESLLQNAVQIQIRSWVPKPAEPLATQLLLTSLQPNLMRDDEQTRLRAEQAAQGIQPEMVTIQQGDIIVRLGATITSEEFALLDHFKLSRRGTDWSSLIGFGVLVSGSIGVYWLVERRFHTKLRQRDRLLICLLTLTTPVLIALRVPSTNLPAVGLLISTVYGAPLGITVTGLLTVLLPIGMMLDWSHLLSSAAGGLLCGAMAGRLRSREELSLLGTAVGMLQGGLYLLFNVASGVAWYTLLGS